MQNRELPNLPIKELLPDICRALEQRDELVIEAAPGAGKTTLVPLALLDASWRKQGKIIVLEPRRVAARAAAERMAELFGEPVGKTVGYRIRLENKISKDTVIEVVTEGILTRWLQDDPELSEVAAIIFDEFHERSIHSDLGLALCLKAREIFRDGNKPLKLVIMSATLDGVAVGSLLNDAPVLRSEGRSYEVSIRYGSAMQWGERIDELVVSKIVTALQQQQGDILVFLPGMAEIQRCMGNLNGQVGDNVVVLPLHGSLNMAEQQQALRPLADKNKCKIILATDIAETSLTIDGVTTVVDSGLVRKPDFDLRTGMTRLATQRISKASSVQRAGRAGRLGPGVCYRLWSEDQQAQLARYSTPEMLSSDLAPLMLQLLQWGVSNTDELQWLDAPPSSAANQALDLLCHLGAVEKNNRQQLSAHGQRMANLPLHPRLAHMLLRSIELGAVDLACLIAAALAEKIPMQTAGADFNPVLEVLLGERRCDNKDRGWQQRSQQMAKNFRAQLDVGKNAHTCSLNQEQAAAVLLACAYPDRIARQRSNNRELYQLSNGRAAMLPQRDALVNCEWLVVCDAGGMKNSSGGVGSNADRIYFALPLDAGLFSDALSDLVSEELIIDWQDDRLLAEQRRCIGEIVLESKPANNISREQKNGAIVQWLRRNGLQALPWTEDLQQWRARIALLRHHFPDQQPPWPDFSDLALTSSLQRWLLPYLDQVNKRQDLNKLELKNILSALLPWPLPKQLDELAPQGIAVPSGSHCGIDYTQSPPVLEVKLQEMFGTKTTPTVANGKVKLLVHLLSPARRPIQITQDLEGFWNGSYADVKKEMKGRYPKHPWPDNPWDAPATKLTKKRLQKLQDD